MTPLIDRAIGFAARAHEGQRRKTGLVPFIAHPVAVAMTLLAMGCDERVVAAGLLHDTVEDAGVTLAELGQIFGQEVAAIVAACSEPARGHSWETRKQHLIESLRTAPLEAKLVAAADKLHNLSHMAADGAAADPAFFEPFSRGIEQQAWYFRAMAESIAANVVEPDRYPIFTALAERVEQVFGDLTPIAPRPPRSGP